jgi:hypothetical protein
MDDITSKMGFIFCNLVNHCSNDLSKDDVEKILPILFFLENNNNYEASLLLANYHDPSGCIFKNVVEELPENYATAMIHYAKAAQITKNGASDREKEVFEYCFNNLKEYELASGKKI